MKKIINKQAEAKLKEYFKSLELRESLNYKLEISNKHKKVVDDQLLNGIECKKDLEDIKAQILKLSRDIRLIENEFADVEIALDRLNERDRLITINRCRDKKTYKEIGSETYLSESRVHQIMSDILDRLYNEIAFRDMHV